MEGGGGEEEVGLGGGGCTDSSTHGGNILDPSAEEFYPSFLQHNQQLPLVQQQFYISYPPPQHVPLPPTMAPPPSTPPPSPTTTPPVQYPRPVYVSHGPREALPDNIETRSLLLTSVSPSVTEGLVRMDLEGFGGVRAVEMSRLFEERILTVHFYDLRSARSAMEAIREQHVRQQAMAWHRIQQQGNWVDTGAGDGLPLGMGTVGGRVVWAQFAPELPVGVDGLGNGSLVVFNLDPQVSSDDLRRVFEPYGAVKETRETPMKPGHKFVEFYDVRDASRALHGLDGQELLGRRMSIRLSRPGGNGRSNYCRKSSVHQALQLPPRLTKLPHTSSGKSTSSSSRGRAGGGGGSPQSSDGGNIDVDHNVVERRRQHRQQQQQQQHAKPQPNRSSSSSSSSSSSERKHASSSSASTSSKNKNWRNQHRNRAPAEARFLIKGDAATEGEGGGGSSSSSSSACRDSRTTVMIKNIPNKYSQKLLLNMLDIHCLRCNEQIAAAVDGDDEERGPFSSYDFVYLPIDFNNKCNVGYGFVNMTSPEATWRLYKAFHSRPWEVFNSRKICQITYARLQGLEALMEHFRNSKFACDNDEYMPVVFSPPRDGKNNTRPSIIGGRGTGTAISSSSVADITMATSLLRLPSSTSTDEPTEPSSPPDGEEEAEDNDDGGDAGV